MEVDYGPALPPRLGADHHNTSDQHSGLSEEPSKKASDRLKKHSHKSMTLNRGPTLNPPSLATAPQVFTMIVKEVKLMALSRGLRLHQYLDDWLIRSQSQEEAQLNT